MKMSIRVKRGPGSGSLTSQLTNQLASLIDTGVWAAGQLLPSERTLAEAAGVARNVVRRSYDYLTTSGRVEGQGRTGRRVRAKTSSRRGPHEITPLVTVKVGKTATGKKRSASRSTKKSAKKSGKRSAKSSSRGGAKKASRKR